MKKIITIYLFSLLIATGVMTTSQNLKAEFVCPTTFIWDGSKAPGICKKTCTTPNLKTANGGIWAGNGQWNGIWNNKEGYTGQCTSFPPNIQSVCECIPNPPPPPSCCDKCLTTFNTCISEGKSPPLTCSLNWQNCETACQKSAPGKQCTPPKGAILHLKKY